MGHKTAPHRTAAKHILSSVSEIVTRTLIACKNFDSNAQLPAKLRRRPFPAPLVFALAHEVIKQGVVLGFLPTLLRFYLFSIFNFCLSLPLQAYLKTDIDRKQ